MNKKPKWVHQTGDRYFVVQCQFAGNTKDGFRPVYTLKSGSYAQIKTAFRLRCLDLGHDDFNLAVTRNGRLVALLWNDELVDDGPDELAEVVRQIGILGDMR